MFVVLLLIYGKDERLSRNRLEMSLFSRGFKLRAILETPLQRFISRLINNGKARFRI